MEGGSADEVVHLELIAATLRRRQRVLEAQRELAQAQALAEEQRRRLEEQARSNRRLRQRAVVLTIVLGVALLAMIAAVIGFSQARQRAEEAQQQALASAAQASLSRGEPNQALALALAAINKQSATPPDEVTAG